MFVKLGKNIAIDAWPLSTHIAAVTTWRGAESGYVKDRKMAHEGGGHSDQDISVTIGTPKGALTGTFPKTATVQEVIDYAVTAEGLAGEGTAFELFWKTGDTKQLLTPNNRPLVSFGLADGAKLILAATGSGV